MGPVLCNELQVPTEKCVGSDYRCDVSEGATTDGLTSNREPAALIVGESKSSGTELLLENAVLLPEILDDCVLLAANPASQGGNKDLPRLEHGRHPTIVALGRRN